MAAGTLTTLRLLLAARDRLGSLPELPPLLGSGFTLNGGAVAGQWRTSGLARSDDGPTVTAVHRTRDEAGRSRFVVGEAGLPLNGLPIPRWLRPRLQWSSALLAYGRERADARITLAGRHVTTDVARDHDPAIDAAIEATMRSVATAYEPSRRMLGCSDHPRGRLLSVHPLGGAAVGRTPAEGVVDHAGEVFGHPGLYIADGSLYPAAPGIPPSMTIAVLAERIADLATR